MTRVAVIGAGRRVLGAILPALHCLRDRFELAAVYARREREIDYGLGRVVTRSSREITLDGVDLVAVAVGLDAIPELLGRLAARRPRHAVLLLDTPVLPPSRLDAARHFAAFRRVLVAEDNLALPPFLLARRLIDDGAIGDVRRIYFFHNGYKYHALASLKLLAGAPITGLRSRRYKGKLRQKQIELANGTSAIMYEPRDYAVGRFLVEGTRGAIADYSFDGPAARIIGYRLDGPVYRGLTLDGSPLAPAGLDAAYLAHAGPTIPEASPMNTMKLRGLMDVLAGALEDRSPFHYAPGEGVTDALAIRIADRVGWVPALGLLARLGRR
ncbi:MAG: hypothetical protein KIT31_00605 [Deltaproteobacteria bacterium]|nr:hypothetical protein [Deltaproteobacteria bacterium]